MKHFTRIGMLLLMFMTVSVIAFAQNSYAPSAQEEEQILALEQAALEQHGPTVEVPDANGSRATGDDCSDPIAVTLPGALPYTDNNYTCGRGDNYSTTCMGSYDGGEDVIYEFTVTSDVWVEINMDPSGTTWTGIGLFEGCPDAGTCISYVTGSSGSTVKTITAQLTAGITYYFMVDTWPSPACIPSFDLEILDVTPTWTPVDTFPFLADFEDGNTPDEITVLAGGNTNYDISPDAAFNSDFGERHQGNTSSGWSNNSNAEDNFIDNPSHIISAQTKIIPSGGAGMLTATFMLKQTYTYNNEYYSNFRVTVNGTPVASEEGWIYRNASDPDGDPFVEAEYDLSPWQDDPELIIALESANKYYAGYTSSYPWGDCSYIDDFQIFYKQDPGYVEGFVTNYDGLPVSQATVTHTGSGTTAISAPNGSYFIGPVAGGDQEFTASKAGYNTTVDMVTVPPADTTEHNFTLVQPNFVIQPLLLDVEVNPEEYYETNLSILNTGSGELTWSAIINYLSDGDGIGISNVKAQSSDVAETHAGNASQANSRAQFDLQFSFDADGPSGLTGLAGSETDGTYIYAARWSGNEIAKFDMDGNYIETFTIPGVSGIRDMAYDGQYFYGGAASTTIYEMDFDNQTLVSSWSSPTAVRAIAYDSDNDAFWVNNWDTDLTLVDRSGSSIATISGPPSIYGMAYDNFSDGGPYLWVFSGTTSGGGCQVEQMDIASGSLTGLSHSVSGDLGDLIAGGLWIQPGIVPGFVTLGGLGQGTPDMIFGYELVEGGGASGNWLSLDNYEGTVPPFGGSYNVGVNFDAAGMTAGEVHTAEIVFTSDPNVGTITVPVTMTVVGDPLVGPTDLEVQITNMAAGTVALSWTGVPAAPNFNHYLIKRNNMTVGTTTGTTFTQTLPDYGEYCYAVYASYNEGNSTPAGPECVEWFLPQISVNTNSLSATVFEGEMVEVTGLTIENTGMTGSMLSWNIDFDPATGFIEDINPNSGILDAGESVDLRVLYSADGYTAGTYNQTFDITSNDNNNPTVTIDNEMTVLEAAMFEGQVTDGNTGAPLQGVTINASGTPGEWSAETNDLGFYELKVEEGTYDLTFNKPGYQNETVDDVTATMGDVTVVDVQMFEEAYAPQFVIATPNADDTECLVEWGLPAGPYLIVYDDGTAENMFAWTEPGGINAVKFTPAGYPAVVTGGEVYIGDGFFPTGGQVLGTTFGMAVYDDDGPNGMPGTVLDSVSVEVGNFGWVMFDELSAAITEGDFYLGMIQGSYSPNTAGIGIDETLPVAYRSYQKAAGADWMVSAYQDFMMRAIVDGPDGTISDDAAEAQMIVPNYKQKVRFSDYAVTLKERAVIPAGKEMKPEYKPYTGEMDMRGVEMYTLTRFSNFDPLADPPELGDATLLDDDLTVNEYTDAAFGSLPMGYYKYGVTAIFTNGDESDYAISNVVGHLMRYDVTINVSTTDNLSVEGAIVQLEPNENTYGEGFYEIVPDAGTVELADVWRGEYSLTVFLPGYYAYVLPTVYILEDMTIDVVLQEGRWPVNDLWVDPLTSIAYWNAPTPGVVLFEDFEGEDFPPEGWTTSSSGEGWFRSDNAGTGAWGIPPGDGFYAVTNDDDAASGNNACCDYLTSPPVDLALYQDYLLVFDSFYDALYGGSATVEYSTNGTDWEELLALTAASSWTEVAIDLADWSGVNAAGEDFWFRFHYDDNGAWADGWAVDNVTVASAASMIFRDTDELTGYAVYLDGAYRASTAETTYQYVGLQYGQTYEASVAALYSSGPSEKMYYTFTSLYLIPPDSLEGEQLGDEDAAYLTWAPPLTPSTMRAGISDITATSSKEAEGYEGRASDNAGRAQFDLQFSFDVDTPSGLTGLAGSETDGEYIYALRWSGNEIAKFNMDGSFVETFSIPGVSGIRDVAYDGQYFYGGAAANTIYQMDFDNQTLVSSWSSPVAVRAIAYDEDNDAFWVNNWDTDLTLVDRSGSSIATISGPPSIYGMAFDEFSEDGPYLWLFSGTTTGGGCQIEQMDIATGTLTGLSHSVSGDLGDLIAGGLWIQPNIVTNKVTIGGLGQGTPDMVFGYELTDYTGGGPGPGGEIPENLLGYNVYRDAWGEDDDPIAYVEGQLNTEYYDLELAPGTYEYAVTAVYDLTPYGFPGETDESMIEGPVEVEVTYGFPLPFTEMWNLGNFSGQQWTVDCDNWWVNGNAGNPAPSAEFTWDDPMTDYECGLISYPMKASQYEEGAIFLDFDLKLDDRNMTGEEYFVVRIWENGSWSDVWEMSNNGDMDWTSYHIDLSGDAIGNDFRIGFFAMGMNSADIFGWMLDNIEIYFECPAPFDLTGSIEDPTVTLNWMSPDTVGPVSEWLHYDDGVNYTGVGYNGPGDFDAAIRFEPSQLGDYDGTFLTEVSFFPSEAQCEYSIRVWTGANAGTMVVDQLVTNPIIGAWNTVTLDTPVEIDASQELWFGYRNNAQAGYPAGADAGPAVVGYGDMIYDATTGWISMATEYGLDYNWNIQGFVTSETDGVMALTAIEDNNRKANENAPEVSSPAVQTAASVFEPTNRAFVGYNVFRSHNDGPFEQINEDLVTETTYVDEVTTGGMYCYYIESIFEGCESDSSNNVCVISTVGIDELVNGNGLVVYPNPARDLINVASDMNIERVTVLNYLGQVVSDRTVAGSKEVQIGTTNIEDGIYFIKIETEDGIVTEKVTIAR